MSMTPAPSGESQPKALGERSRILLLEPKGPRSRIVTSTYLPPERTETRAPQGSVRLAAVAVPAARSAERVTAVIRRRRIRASSIRILTPAAGDTGLSAPAPRHGRSWVLNHLLSLVRDRPVVPAPCVRTAPGRARLYSAPPL